MFGFATPEEMVFFLHRHMMEQQAKETREVPEIGFGDCWIRVVDFVPEVVPIFGCVLTPEELERRLVAGGASREEAKFEVQMVVQMHSRGFRYSECYSTMCPEGELKDTHVNEILLTITREEFEAARTNGWELLPLMLEGHEFASRVMQVAGLEP